VFITTDDLAHRNRSAPARDPRTFVPSNERGRNRLRHTTPLINRTPNSPVPPVPVYPNISTPSRQIVSEEDIRPRQFDHIVGTPFQPFLPEDTYLAKATPTRNSEELRIFKQHCLYLLQHRPDVHIDHLFTDLFKVTPHPIIFNGFLWKYRTSITNEGILEDYRLIDSEHSTESTRLTKQCTVFYSWEGNSYTVTLV
jgi:hypothetical protein